MSPSTLSLLVDENIPCATEAFGTLGTVQTMPGRDMSRADLQGVDVLLVRSVTQVGPELLQGTPVRFVGSATIGTDHVDRDYLEAEGIPFAHAPASNADSVADYVIAGLLRLAVRRSTTLRGRTAGIVGCGNIGARLSRRLSALGMNVLHNDPPLADAAEAHGRTHDYVSLERVLADADVVTLHTPLRTEGPHPTRYLFDDEVLGALRPGAWLVNTSRGAVVDNAALRDHLADDASPLDAAMLDVWENEPTPDLDLLRGVDLATPHVAGYAFDGKVRGTTMLYRALCRELGEEGEWSPESVLQPESPGELALSPPDPRRPEAEWLDALARQACDVVADDRRLRPILDEPSDTRGTFFSRLRKTYPRRREMQTQHLAASSVPDDFDVPVRDGLTVELR